MRAGLLLGLAALCVRSGIAQPDLWQHVGSHPTRKFDSINLSQARQQTVSRLLKARALLDGWCEPFDGDEWLKHLSYEAIPLSTKAKVVLVEAGRGCARSGQGSNGAMWLIRFDGLEPVLLASPQQGFGGWVYSVEPKTSIGYRDIVTAWHMGASEADLTYFRFDGRSYRRIGSATFRVDDNGTERIVPGPASP